MKKAVHRKAYKYTSKQGKTVYVPACTYFVNSSKQEKGAGSEYEQTVFDRDAWSKKQTERQGTFPGMVNRQARLARVTEYFNTKKVTPTGVLRAIWDTKKAPTKANLAKAVRWVKRNTPEYLPLLDNCSAFKK